MSPTPIDRSWLRIEAWLQHNAPASFAELNPPASSEQLSVLEVELDRPLPSDLRTYLRRHNGCTQAARSGLIQGSYDLIEVDSIRRQRAGILRLPFYTDDVEEWGYDPSWLPLAANSSTGLVMLRLDDPGRGQLWTWDAYPIVRQQIAPTLAAFFEQTADILDGTTTIDATPRVDSDGRLDWQFPPPVPRTNPHAAQPAPTPRSIRQAHPRAVTGKPHRRRIMVGPETTEVHESDGHITAILDAS